MSLKVDKVQLEIIMKSDATRAEIIKLEDTAKSLQKQMRGLKKDSEEYAKTSAEYKKVRGRIDELRGSIELAGKTMRELMARSRELRAMLNNLTPGSEKWQQYDAELKQVNARMRELRGTAQKTEGLFSKSAGRFNKYFALLGTLAASITGLSLTFRKLAEDVAKMDDVYSDVMKTTGNTKEQVLELNEELKKMDTRTSRESLNLLARDAGKLGLQAKKDILDFVDAGNQINVALGEDLGEDAIKNIGKMVGVFEKSTDHLRKLDLKGQMLAVGSAINELGASSTASEPYLVQFAGRLGGIATQAGISIDQILGFASALDQDMQAVEMSATALQKFIMKIMEDPAKFAKIAGMEVKKFSELLRTDANAAIKEVLRSLGGKDGLEALLPIFKDMGLDGARAAQVISSMAGSLDKIDEAQRVANESMREGTSLTTEYNIKNENLAAKLDKARKNFKEVSLELGQSLNPLLLKSTDATSYLIKALVVLLQWLKENAGKVTALVLVIAAYTVATYASVAADKLKVFWNEKLIKSLKSLWATMRANPYAAIATGLMLVIGFLIDFIHKKRTAIDLEKEHLAISKEATANTREEVNELNRLKKVLYDSNKSYDERNAALKRIKEIVPEYLGQLTTENKLIKDNADALDYYAKKLVLSEKMKLASQKQAKQEEELSNFLDDNKDLTRQYVKATSEANDLVLSGVARDFDEALNMTLKGAGMRAYRAMVTEYGKNIDTYEKMIENFSSDLAQISPVSNPINEITPNTLSDAPGGEGNQSDPASETLKAAESAYKKELAALKNSLIEKEITEKEFAEKGESLLLAYYKTKLEIQRKYGKDTSDTENEIADWKLKQQKTADELLLDDIKKANDAKLAALAEYDILQKDQLQDQVDAGLLTNSEYLARLRAIELTSAQSRLIIAKDFQKFVEESEFHSAEAKEKAVNEAAKAVEQAQKAEEKAVKDSNRAKLKSQEDYERERKQLLQSLGLLSIREQYQLEKKELDKHLAEKLLSEQEHAEVVRKLKLKAAEGYAQQAVQFAGYVADAVTAYHQMEADSLEAEKQRELSAAGNNAEERERIEKAYAQKELDLKKKQANADAGIKIAQTIAAGALAAIQAYAQLGPIAGKVAAVIIAATTGLQIASIIKQRNAILATTLNTSGGSSPAKTGARVAQAEHGRYDVVGEDDNRTYRNVPYRGVARSGIVRTPTLVAERGDELIVSNPHLRNIRMNAPYLINELMRYRVPQRAEGKYDSITKTELPQSNAVLEQNIAMMNEIIILLKYLKEYGVDAFVLLSEIERKQAMKNKLLKLGGINNK